MKALLLLVVAALLLPRVDAEVRDERELEREAENFEKRMTFSDPEAAAAWKKSREQVAAYRLECYEKAVRRNGGTGSISATNPPECTYYSTEGVCTLPNTRIAPYPKIAHVNTLLDFKFPKMLGGCKALYIDVYPKPEWGYSIRYAAPDTDAEGRPQTHADVYIYDMPISMMKPEMVVVEHLKEVAGGLRIYQNVVFDQNIGRSHFVNGDKLPFFFFYAQFEKPNHQHMIEKCQSFAMVFSKNRKFVKLRITQRNGTRESFEKFVEVFLADFDRAIILDSQTRTRKFEKVVVYPVILLTE